MNDPLARDAKILYPEPWNPEDYETVRELNPALQGEVPDKIRFPWPPGSEGGAFGWQFKSFSDAQQGNIKLEDIKLEVIWQPLWDTQKTMDNMGTLLFFQNPAGRSTMETNVPSAGCLTWPKRFYLWEIVFQFALADIEFFIKEKGEKQKELWKQIRDNHIWATLIIGEKIHFTMPLSMMFNPREGHYRAALPMPLYFPPMQHFRVSLAFNRPQQGMKNKIRCLLNGYLARDIQ